MSRLGDFFPGVQKQVVQSYQPTVQSSQVVGDLQYESNAVVPPSINLGVTALSVISGDGRTILFDALSPTSTVQSASTLYQHTITTKQVTYFKFNADSFINTAGIDFKQSLRLNAGLNENQINDAAGELTLLDITYTGDGLGSVRIDSGGIVLLTHPFANSDEIAVTYEETAANQITVDVYINNMVTPAASHVYNGVSPALLTPPNGLTWVVELNSTAVIPPQPISIENITPTVAVGASTEWQTTKTTYTDDPIPSDLYGCIIQIVNAPIGSSFADGEQYLVSTGGQLEHINMVKTWTTIDSDYIAVGHKEDLLVDTNLNPVTVSLKANPVPGDRIALVPLSPTYDLNNLTVYTNGNNIMGSLSNLIVNQVGISLEIVFVGGSTGWAVMNQGDVGLINQIDPSGVGAYYTLTDTGIGHTHSVVLTDEQIRSLIEGEVQSVVNASSLNSGHSHNVTVEFINGIFVITDIESNHAGNPHGVGYTYFENPNGWLVVDSNYELTASQQLLADSLLGSFSITLPESPVLNTRVAVAPLHPSYVDFPVSIVRNPVSNELINGGTDDVILNSNGASVELSFVGGTVGWALINKGETTIINNISVDPGTIVATQPGDNNFSGNNTFSNNTSFSAPVLVPTPVDNSNPATKLYVDTEIANNVPSGVAFLDGGNTYTSGNQNFSGVTMTIAAPTSNSNPTTKFYVDNAIASNVPSDVAFTNADNTFIAQNTFSNQSHFNGTVNFNGLIDSGSLFSATLHSSSNSGMTINNNGVYVRYGLGDRLELQNSNSQPTVTLAGDVGSNTLDVTNVEFVNFIPNQAMNVDSPLNVNIDRGGQLNIVDSDSATMVIQAGGDFEISSFSGNLWVQGFRMPNSDGTVGQVLTTDGDGSLTFQDGLDGTIDQVVTGKWIFDTSVSKVFAATDDPTFAAPLTTMGVFDYATEADPTARIAKTEIVNDRPATVRSELRAQDGSHSVTNTMSAENFNVSANLVVGTNSSTNSYITLTADEITVSQDPTSPLGVATRQMVDPGVEEITGTSYTVTVADKRKTLEFTNASTISLTINSGLGDDFSFTVVQGGDGKIVWNGTAVVNNVDSHVRTRGKYAMATFVSRLDGNFVVGGATE